ncbi:MAG: hypothetical protein LWW95_11955 [Candidatus Desulfofervidus auxilii]|nr:hypothetical protein [Candidatus Desulfofervidus auxilii]
MRKLSDFFKGEARFIAVTSLMEDILKLCLNSRYSLFFDINLMNIEICYRADWMVLYEKYTQFYRFYMPMLFYLFLKVDFLKKGEDFYMELNYRKRYIIFRSLMPYLLYEKINTRIIHLNPFLIAICALLPNFEKDKIIIRGMRQL